MPTDISCWVGFYEQVEIARRHIGADGSVRAHDFFYLGDAGLGVGDGKGSCEGNVLTDRQAENVARGGQTEAVDGRVVRDNCFRGEGETVEGGGVKGLFFFCLNEKQHFQHYSIYFLGWGGVCLTMVMTFGRRTHAVCRTSKPPTRLRRRRRRE